MMVLCKPFFVALFGLIASVPEEECCNDDNGEEGDTDPDARFSSRR